jgi:hypothetical protein
MNEPPTGRPFAHLLQAYQRTRYRVLCEQEGHAVVAEAIVDTLSAEIDALLRRHDAGSGVFITAWNPRSMPQSRTVNEVAHQRLGRDLRQLGIRQLPHLGVGDDPGWEAERGILALDLPLADALALAVTYGQNAVVVVERGQPARLVLTELMPADAGG